VGIIARKTCLRVSRHERPASSHAGSAADKHISNTDPPAQSHTKEKEIMKARNIVVGTIVAAVVTGVIVSCGSSGSGGGGGGGGAAPSGEVVRSAALNFAQETPTPPTPSTGTGAGGVIYDATTPAMPRGSHF